MAWESRCKIVGAADATDATLAFGDVVPAAAAEEGDELSLSFSLSFSRSLRDRPPTAPLNAASNWRDASPITGRDRRGGAPSPDCADAPAAVASDVAAFAFVETALGEDVGGAERFEDGAEAAPLDAPRSR